jgi:hypothetical protein
MDEMRTLLDEFVRIWDQKFPPRRTPDPNLTSASARLGSPPKAGSHRRLPRRHFPDGQQRWMGARRKRYAK